MRFASSEQRSSTHHRRRIDGIFLRESAVGSQRSLGALRCQRRTLSVENVYKSWMSSARVQHRSTASAFQSIQCSAKQLSSLSLFSLLLALSRRVLRPLRPTHPSPGRPARLAAAARRTLVASRSTPTGAGSTTPRAVSDSLSLSKPLIYS